MKLLILALALIFFMNINFGCTPRHHKEDKHVQIQKKVEQLVEIKRTFNKK